MAVVEALLQFGANPNLVREDGCSPLIIASEMGHWHVVKALLESENGFKIDTHAQTANGHNAMSVAASDSIIELLHGYDMESQVDE